MGNWGTAEEEVVSSKVCLVAFGNNHSLTSVVNARGWHKNCTLS